MTAWAFYLIDAVMEAEYGNGSMSDVREQQGCQPTPVTKHDLDEAVSKLMSLLGLDRVALLAKLVKQTERLVMKTSELKPFFDNLGVAVDALTAEATKIATEVQTLKDSLGGELDADTQASLDRLSASITTLTAGVKKVDDIIPDSPVVTPG